MLELRRRGPVTRRVVDGVGSTVRSETMHAIEITGHILPHALQALCRLLEQTQGVDGFEAVLSVDDKSVPLNVGDAPAAPVRARDACGAAPWTL